MKEITAFDRMVKEVSTITRKWNLKFTFASIDYLLNVENVSLIQCAEGIFPAYGQSKEDCDYDSMKAIKILLMAGDVGSTGLKDIDELEKRALDRMDEWRKKTGNMDMLHTYLVGILKEEHFFSGALPVGQKINQILKQIGSRNN